MKPLPLTWLVSALKEAAQAPEPQSDAPPRIIEMRLCADGVRRPANSKPRKTIQKVISDFWSDVDKNGPVIRPELGPCWVWTGNGVKHGGYGYVFVGTHEGSRRSVPAHRFSYILHTLTDPGDLLVCHTCDNRRCVNPAHHFLGTDLDNTRDRVSKGRPSGGARGERHNMAKLREWQVREIRAFFDANGQPLGCISMLARKYGVHRNSIYGILHREHWKCITAKNL